MSLFKKANISALLIPLFFLTLSLIINGYQRGRPVDLILVLHKLDPQTFQKDLFVQTIGPLSYTLPHQLIALLAQLFRVTNHPEVIFFPLYLVSTLFLLLIVYQIAQLLLKHKTAASLFLLLFILNFRAISLGPQSYFLAEGRPQISPNYLALPFQLLSLLLLFKNKYLFSLVVAGVALNVHPLTSIYAYIILVFYYLINLKKFTTKQLFLWWTTSFLVASPVLIGVLSSPRINFIIDEKTFEIARYTTRGLTTFLHFPFSSFFYSTLIFVFVLVCIKIFPPQKRNLVLTVFATVILMISVNFLMVDVFRLPFGLMFSFLRASIFLDFFGLIAIVNYLYQSWQKRRIPKLLIILVFASITFSLYRPFAFIVILILMFEFSRLLAPKHGLILKGIVSVLGYISVGGLIIILLHPPLPSSPYLFYLLREKPHLGDSAPPPEREKSWIDVQRWSNTTPKNSLFLILVRNKAFNLYSQRATINFGETVGNLIFSPKYALIYIQQMEDLGFNFTEMEKENNVAQQGEKIFQEIPESKIRNFSNRYEVDYFIVYRYKKIGFPLAYQNDDFSVYKTDVVSSER